MQKWARMLVETFGERVMPRQSLQNHLSGHIGGWMMPWSAEEMLGGQYQRVDIPANATTAHNGLLKKRLQEDLR